MCNIINIQFINETDDKTKEKNFLKFLWKNRSWDLNIKNKKSEIIDIIAKDRLHIQKIKKYLKMNFKDNEIKINV